ncbi:MAG: seryl-tRNA synthetase [Flavobacteriaceae bacterium]|jgi:seryl-tRNA synthetase
MLDIHFIKAHPELITEAARKKHIDFNVQELLDTDKSRVELVQEVEGMRREQNEITNRIKSGVSEEERNQLISEMQIFKGTLKEKEEKLKEVMVVWQSLMLKVPNIPDMSVPEGKEDSDNVEIKKEGNIPEFDFPIKDHVELMTSLDMVDFERGVKVSGFRGYILKGMGARLAMALWQYTLNFFVQKGYTPLMVPSLVSRKTLVGTGYLPGGEDDLYVTQDDEYLAGTGEVATMAYHSGEILEKSDLPKKFITFSPCFRREAGSHSKDTKGLIRVHEFFKLEQVVLCEASHQISVELHEELERNAEELMESLEIPYHVVLNCGGDLGQGQVKKYDIEAWVPSQSTYRETHSCSYFHDFQTRRLNIRYREDDGELLFAHSLNNTALATPRALVPLVENFQNADGSITVPKVLVPYMGTDKITLQ